MNEDLPGSDEITRSDSFNRNDTQRMVRTIGA